MHTVNAKSLLQSVNWIQVRVPPCFIDGSCFLLVLLASTLCLPARSHALSCHQCANGSGLVDLSQTPQQAWALFAFAPRRRPPSLLANQVLMRALSIFAAWTVLLGRTIDSCPCAHRKLASTGCSCREVPSSNNASSRYCCPALDGRPPPPRALPPPPHTFYRPLRAHAISCRGLGLM